MHVVSKPKSPNARRFNAASIVNRTKQAGTSMVEMIIYIMVVVAIVGFAFSMKTMVYGPFLGWMEAMTVSNAMGKIENVHSGAANYAGLTTAGMATGSIFQTKYLPGGGTINNRFGGQVTLGIATINTASDTLQFTDGGVRTESCPTLVNQLAEDADRITVAGTIVKPANGTVNATTLKTQCDSANVVAVMLERIKRS